MKLRLLLLFSLLCALPALAHGQTAGGVQSINGVPGPFTFGSGSTCVGTTCTFSGGGGSLPTATAAGQVPVSTAPGTNYAAGTTVPTFNVANLSNVHYANQWCTTPGTLDDTCISNAIADIVTNGPVSGIDSLPMGTVIVPPGTYTINSTITLPSTAHITLIGQYEGSYSGAVLQTGATPVLMIQVNEHGAVISHLSFNGNGTSGTPGTTNAIQLGTSSILADDNHVNWNWFRALKAGIHVVNANGLDMSHNTSDAYSQYFLYTNQPAGDVLMTDTIGSDIRCYAATVACISLVGNNTVSFAINKFSGIFDNGPGTAGAYLQFTNMLQTGVQGQFYNNAGGDISVSGGAAYNFGPAQFYNSGKTSVSIASATNTALTDSTFLNSAIGTTSGTVPMISCTGCIGYTIARNTSTTLSGGHGYASYGLYVDAPSTGEIYGNNFNSQVTAPYNVLDVSTGSGFQVSGGALVINGTGNPSVGSTTALIQNVGSNYAELETFGANTSTFPDIYIGTKNSTGATADYFLHGVYNTSVTFSDPTILPIYNASTKAIPICASGIKGAQAVVSDATTPTYMGAYTSGGTITTAVICSFDGTTYAWKTH